MAQAHENIQSYTSLGHRTLALEQAAPLVPEPTTNRLRHEQVRIDKHTYLFKPTQLGSLLIGRVRKELPSRKGMYRYSIKPEAALTQREQDAVYNWLSRYWTAHWDRQAEEQ